MDDFREAMLQSDLTTQRCAEWLGVTVRTVQRYCREGAPLMAHRALAPFSGQLPGWLGFKVRESEMLTPCGPIFRGQLENLNWLYGLMGECPQAGTGLLRVPLRSNRPTGDQALRIPFAIRR